MSCNDCKLPFTSLPDLASPVCISCGNLQDPSQSLLSSHIDPVDTARPHNHQWLPCLSLKSLRSTTAWNLPGQGNQVASARNKNVIHQYISALATTLGHPGLAPRSHTLFDQAMLKGHFRWGRKARLVAGACLAIALREAQKGTTMRDIAFLLNETSVAVARLYAAVSHLLQINLISSDPRFHLPVLQTWLKELLAEQPCTLPQNLVHVLKPLHIPNVLRTGGSLSDLVSRIGLLTNLPSPPSSCAIFILAIEAEALASVPHCGELAKALGRRFGVSKDVVMRRYKVIYDQVLKWLAEVPWLDDPTAPTKKKGAKLAKRVAVARGLKDVVQFQADIWHANMKRQGRPEVQIDSDDESSVSAADGRASAGRGAKRTNDLSVLPPQRKRRRVHGRQLDAISKFLLSPLDSSSGNQDTCGSVLEMDVVSHLLTTDTPSLDQLPSRLQLLAGTKRADEITDEELFAEGELQGFLRSTDEVAILAQACDWAQEPEREETHTKKAQKRDRERGGTARVNMDVLNRILADTETECEDADNNEAESDDLNWTAGLDDDWGMRNNARIEVPSIARRKNGVAPVDIDYSQEELEPWRPLSPGAFSSWGDDPDRYDCEA